MARPQRRKRWADVKARLESFDRKGLVSLIGDLYDAEVANRRFLNSRLAPAGDAIEEYRRLVAGADLPSPFGRRQVSVRDVGTAIAAYRRTTGDLVGTVDLILAFVEARTEQTVDLGYGDDAYFGALEANLVSVRKVFDELPADARTTTLVRLARIRDRGKRIGWGYGDVLDDVVRTLTDRAPGAPRPRTSGSRLRGPRRFASALPEPARAAVHRPLRDDRPARPTTVPNETPTNRLLPRLNKSSSST